MLSKRLQISQKILAVFIATLIVFSGSMSYLAYNLGFTNAQATTLTQNTLTGGTIAGAPTYTIFVDSGTYCAKNQWGAISFSGTNATTVIQGAISALTGNGEILFKAGTYAIDGLHVVGLSGVTDNTQQQVTLKGEGQGNTILQLKAGASGAKTSYANDATPAIIYAESPDASGIRLVIEDLQLAGQRQSQTTNIAGIIVNDGRNCLIQGNLIQNVSKWGIAFLKVNTIYRENQIIANTIYDVNDFDGTPSLPLDVSCVGIYVAPRADIYIKDNIIGWIGFNGVDANGYGINLGDSDEAIANTIWAVGVGIQTTQDSKHSQIMDNWLDFCYNASIFINAGLYVTVENNICRIPYNAGILLLNSNNTLVQGNRVYNLATYSTSYLIGESGASDYNTIRGNDLNCSGTITFTKVDIAGAHTTVEGNAGFVTENNGIASVANGGSIANGLDATVPSIAVQLTLLNATYGGEPLLVSWNYGASSITSIVVNLYFANNTAVTTPMSISWEARYAHT